MGNSILDQFKTEYENDIEAIRRGEKAPTDDMNEVERQGREMANQIWANSKLNENPNKDKHRYTTNELRQMGKITETPLPNVVIVRAICPECDTEINADYFIGKYKCPKCGKEYLLSEHYPQIAIKLANGETMMLDFNSLHSKANPHEEDRDEELPSMDEVPECPNWDNTTPYKVADPILLTPDEMTDVVIKPL